jgi:hypothetical protein
MQRCIISLSLVSAVGHERSIGRGVPVHFGAADQHEIAPDCRGHDPIVGGPPSAPGLLPFPGQRQPRAINR